MTVAGSFWIAHQAGYVGHEDEPFGIERDGTHRGGDIGVAVIDLAILAARGRADDRRVAAPDAFLQRPHVDFDDFTDVTDVDLRSGILLVIEIQFFAFEDVGPGETDGLATERVDGLDHLGIDRPREHLIHDLRRRLIGDPADLG